MATRTTTTRTIRPEFAPSADQVTASAGHAYSFESLVQAYFDCRKAKRNSASALAFEESLERNLISLHDDIASGIYQPGRSICFVVTRPKAREVWAAAFRDRVVHHLLYNQVSPKIHASFIADSCACIPCRGTLYAALRLESHVRSLTQNWSRPAYYLKLDLANFFVSIDKRILEGLLRDRIKDLWWMDLAKLILWHDPRQNYEFHGNPMKLKLVPPHKQLAEQPPHLGLPIGNLSSQFFANVYLDVLDQHAKHTIKAKHYVRYVDDFVLLHESPQWLNEALSNIREFLPKQLNAHINERKTILQPVDRGIDFVGQVIHPWHRRTRRKTVLSAIERIATTPAPQLLETGNSYFGLMRQASHSHHVRTQIANALRRRGQWINQDITKTFRATH